MARDHSYSHILIIGPDNPGESSHQSLTESFKKNTPVTLVF
jgi:hypothetical protein